MKLRLFEALLAGVMALGAAGCGGETVLRNADDASRYVDDVLRGKSLSGFKLADDASPVAKAALADSSELSELDRAVEELPSAACDVVGLVSTAAGPVPESPAPLVLSSESRVEIEVAAESAEIPSDLTTQVIDAAVGMAQSTWVDAADNACDVASGL